MNQQPQGWTQPPPPDQSGAGQPPVYGYGPQQQYPGQQGQYGQPQPSQQPYPGQQQYPGQPQDAPGQQQPQYPGQHGQQGRQPFIPGQQGPQGQYGQQAQQGGGQQWQGWAQQPPQGPGGQDGQGGLPQQPGAPFQPPKQGQNRRKVLAIVGGGIAALGIAAFTIDNLVATKQAAVASGNSTDDGYGNINPSTLPTAAGGSGNISQSDMTTLLAQQNKALADRDKTTYLSAFAGSAATQAAITFDNLGKFSFDKLEYQLIGQGGRLFDSGNGSDVEIDVALVHQISGVDANPLPEWYRWTLTRSGSSGPISIKAAVGSPTMGGSAKYVYYPAIWDSPNDIVVEKRANLYVATETQSDMNVMASYVDQFAQAVADNRAAWNQNGGQSGIAPGAMIVGSTNRDKFYYWYSGKANQYGNEAGITIPVVTAASQDNPTSGSYRVGGSRIVLDLTTSYFSDNSGEDVPATLVRHEDTHNMVFSILTANEQSVPLWVIEGFADFMATRVYPNPVQNYLQLPSLKAIVEGQDAGASWDGKTLPTDSQVYALDPEAMGAGYALSTLAFYLIEQNYGMSGVMKFLEANYVVSSQSGNPGNDSVGSAMSGSLGIDITSFQQRWATFVHQTIGV